MTPQEADSVDDRRERLRQHLERETGDGEYYFKSKFIADELGMSPKQLGVLLTQLRESADALHIEKWSYTNATTWRAVPQGEPGG